MRPILLTVVALMILWCMPALADAGTSRVPRFSKSFSERLANTDQAAIRGVIKFREGSGIRMDSGRLIAPPGSRAWTDLSVIEGLLDRYGRAPRPLIEHAETFNRISVHASRDLQLYIRFDTEGTPAREWLALIQAINKSPWVEVAYLEAPDAAAENGGTYAPKNRAPFGITPPLVQHQDYLDPAPWGIDAGSAWSRPGGDGHGVKVMVYDNAYRTTHEDVPKTFYDQHQNGADKAHGTAVMGILGGRNNSSGILGIAHASQFGFQGAASVVESHAERLLEAGMELEAGDVLLTEVGKQVNALGFECACNPSQANSVPLEFYPAEFDVISALIAAGIVVVETAGNGCVDFDSAIFAEVSNNGGNDSGAIWVAASESAQHRPICYTNFGSRVDLHAWGEHVAALSYLRMDEIPLFDKGLDRLYVPNFGGTSAAGAIVAGAAASVQGQAIAATGQPLSPETVRDLLRLTGTPQTHDLQRNIGPMPNLGAIGF